MTTRPSHHGHAEITRHSPRNGFNGCFALSPVTGLVCHRRRRNLFHRLDASVGASGPHDFAVRKPALSSKAQPASTGHNRPSGLERLKRGFHEGRRVAPDHWDRRPERHDDRHQQRGPRQHGPRGLDVAHGGDCARSMYCSFAVGSHHRRSHGKFECRPRLMLDQNGLQDHRKARRRDRLDADVWFISHRVRRLDCEAIRRTKRCCWSRTNH